MDNLNQNSDNLTVTDLFGKEQRYDKDIKGAIISNGKVHDEVVDILKRMIAN